MLLVQGLANLKLAVEDVDVVALGEGEAVDDATS
jgi:hypothetical protein